MALTEHPHVLQLRMPAVAADSLLQKVGPFLRRISAGGNQCQLLSLPEGRPPLFSVIHIQGIDHAVQGCLHRCGTVPGIDGRCQQQDVAFHDSCEYLLHVILSCAGNMIPVFLAFPAGETGADVHVIKIKYSNIRSRLRKPFKNNLCQGIGIPVLSWTSLQTADFHKFCPPVILQLMAVCCISDNGRRLPRHRQLCSLPCHCSGQDEFQLSRSKTAKVDPAGHFFCHTFRRSPGSSGPIFL